MQKRWKHGRPLQINRQTERERERVMALSRADRNTDRDGLPKLIEKYQINHRSRPVSVWSWNTLCRSRASRQTGGRDFFSISAIYCRFGVSLVSEWKSRFSVFMLSPISSFGKCWSDKSSPKGMLDCTGIFVVMLYPKASAGLMTVGHI